MRRCAATAVGLMLVGCGRGPCPPPGLIVSLGDYPSPSTRYTLQLSNPKGTLVHYLILDHESGRKYAPEKE
jgi:hypothetical protein